MINESNMPKYDAGERSCPVCATPLPAHQTWPGARYRFCGAPECAVEVKALRAGRYIDPNEHRCEGGDCSNFVPEGRYLKKPRHLSCCAACWERRDLRGELLLKCACGCGQEFYRPFKRDNLNGLFFLNSQHHGTYLSNKLLTDSCGVFQETVTEYLEGFAKLHYRDMSSVRTALCSFALFLNEQQLDSFEDVTPKIVTQFLLWAKNTDRRSAGKMVSPISTFFKWMIAEGRRDAANPVVGLIHRPREKKRLPRPLKLSEMETTWQILLARGSARLRFATAIAEEAGLRIGEICRLRVEDVDIVQQRVFVRLPNKTNCERWAFFSNKTKQYFLEWMIERDPNCNHDHVLHNKWCNPLNSVALAMEFRLTMCKEYKGKKIHETGWDKWSTHRLRHTMASNLVSGGADAATVMASGGWKTFDAMADYAQVDPDVARSGYNEAMRRSRELKQVRPTKKCLTPGELLARKRMQAAENQMQTKSERCV